MIEQKYLPDLQKKYEGATWIRYDATLDKFNVGDVISEWESNDLFADSKVFVIRNADTKGDRVFDLCSELVGLDVGGRALVLIGNSHNKTTKLGKLIKKSFVVKELTKPEIKPFDMLDCINSRDIGRVLVHSNRLFENEYNHLAMFSLLFGHFLLLRQVVSRRGMPADTIAREIKQHSFRVKKAMVANQFWTVEQIDEALQDLIRLDSFLRWSEYDRTMTIQKMLLQMALIKICS
jgi:DNA polymerase III delta subunit